jgi:uncharacterized protein YecT (DUF1311 family)
MKTTVKQNLWRASGAVALLAFVLPTHAASFDCAKAGTKVEHIICDNPEISKLDDEMVAAYKAALSNKARASITRQEQRQWLKERNKCNDKKCLQYMYKPRISALEYINRVRSSKYTMRNGEGRPLCEQILKRMNDEKSPSRPICGIDMLKSISGVTLPEWQQLDLEKNKRLYMRFLLASMIDVKDYKLVFGSQQMNGGSVESQDIPVPPPSAVPFNENLSEANLSGMWQEAVRNGHEFYRWDGVLQAPDESDVLLIDIGTGFFRYSACPQIQIIRFSKDLLTPKPFPEHAANWLLGPNAISFKYDNESYLMTDDEIHTMDPETQMRTLPVRTVMVSTIRNDNYCRIDTN